jgi:hypothetical protein
MSDRPPPGFAAGDRIASSSRTPGRYLRVGERGRTGVGRSSRAGGPRTKSARRIRPVACEAAPREVLRSGCVPTTWGPVL